MSKKTKKPPALFPDEAKPFAACAIRMRLPAGKFAILATEAEVRIDGARVAGGNGSFEFDIAQEAWVDINIVRA